MFFQITLATKMQNYADHESKLDLTVPDGL